MLTIISTARTMFLLTCKSQIRFNVRNDRGVQQLMCEKKKSHTRSYDAKIVLMSYHITNVST